MLYKILASKSSNEIYFIAIKKPKFEWHYFEENDSDMKSIK
jgi:hypothetical protein